MLRSFQYKSLLFVFYVDDAVLFIKSHEKNFLSLNQIILPIGLVANVYDFSGSNRWFTWTSFPSPPPSIYTPMKHNYAFIIIFFIAVFHSRSLIHSSSLNILLPLQMCCCMSMCVPLLFPLQSDKIERNKAKLYYTLSASFWHNPNHSPIKLKLWKFRVLLFIFSLLVAPSHFGCLALLVPLIHQ